MNAKEISFVVQGPPDWSLSPLTGKPVTQSCLESLRKHHPGCQVIFSTWHGQLLQGLDFDILVQSEDPGSWSGARPGSKRIIIDNVNRQIVSTRGGLDQVTTRYAVKIRSDLILQGNNWTRYFGLYPLRSKHWKVFRERVITCSLFTRDPNSAYWNCPMHPSDWLHAGLTEDIRLLWEVDRQTEPESSQWFLTHPQPPAPMGSDGSRIDDDVRRFYPEQYLWQALLKKFGSINFEDRRSSSAELSRITEISFANNLVILDPAQFPVVSRKYPFPLNPPWERYRLVSHKDWEWMYRAHCAQEHAGSLLDKMYTPQFYLKKAVDAALGMLRVFREVRSRIESR